MEEALAAEDAMEDEEDDEAGEEAESLLAMDSPSGSPPPEFTILARAGDDEAKGFGTAAPVAPAAGDEEADEEEEEVQTVEDLSRVFLQALSQAGFKLTDGEQRIVAGNPAAVPQQPAPQPRADVQVGQDGNGRLTVSIQLSMDSTAASSSDKTQQQGEEAAAAAAVAPAGHSSSSLIFEAEANEEPPAPLIPAGDARLGYTWSMLESVNEVLFQRHGYRRFRGPLLPSAYVLHLVLETGLGCPILLGLVYMEVCQRLGLEMEGMVLEDYFVVWPKGQDLKVGGTSLCVDVYSGGEIMRVSEGRSPCCPAASLPACRVVP